MRRIVARAMVIVFFGLTACSRNDRQSDVSQYIQKVRTAEPHAIEPIPAFEPLQQFSYPEDQERRSPFQTKVSNPILQTLAPDMQRQKQPLEAFPLDALKFVGVLEEGMRRWALIMAPQGGVVRVSVGDYMGENYGKVIAVKENSLMIEERILQEGNWTKRIVTFRLDELTPAHKQAR